VQDFPIVYVNPAFEALTGYRAEDVLGRNCRLLQGPGSDPRTITEIGRRLRAGQFVRVRILNYRADGSAFWCELHISAVRDTDGRVSRFVAIQHDATDEVTLLEEMSRAATLDPLTGLMNRTAFAAAMERELARAHRHDRAVGVLFLDVDRFKQVNDTHGHPVGDQYLLHVARTLRLHLRGEDVCARHGGDEFTVLLSDLPHGAAGAEAAASIVRELRAALDTPFTLGVTRHRPSVTVGLALYPSDATTGHELVLEADADMYRRKHAPRAHATDDWAPKQP
jgi:diguanylate cyclase (GGDEF)-like protein/PAS domain S-box-containing protein